MSQAALAAHEAEPLPPQDTPWGRGQYFERIDVGIWHVACTGHGGIWLSPDRQASLDPQLAPHTTCKSLTWWEEDCDFTVPGLIFEDSFRAHALRMEEDPDSEVDRMRRILTAFKPAELVSLVDAARA